MEMILTRREEQETSVMTEIEEYIEKNDKIKENNNKKREKLRNRIKIGGLNIRGLNNNEKQDKLKIY
jgi:hypothetical protein